MQQPESLPDPHRAVPHTPRLSLLSQSSQRGTGQRVGFIATRLAGTDGVSLEARKWASVLERMGHHCFYFAGLVDMAPEQSRVVPEAFFGHPEVAAIQEIAFTQAARPPEITRRIHELTQYLKAQIAAFVRDFDLDMLIVENALTIPMHIPLGLALTEFIAETTFPTIAHHHDFFWERQRFLTNCIEDYLAMSFPPRLPSIRHVVINSLGANQLSLRTGSASLLIPNVMDFDHSPPPPDSCGQQLRADLGIPADEWLVLQPTRIIQRKGIEHAVELVSRLQGPARLVISHESGDEGDDYQQRVRNFATLLGVQIEFVSHLIGDRRERTADGRTIYSLADIYHQADLVSYPSIIEGFGNAFLEAVYFRRPIVINNYPIFDTDIRPKGFRVIEFQNYIAEQTVRQTREVLENLHLAQELAEHNYLIARHYYSYSVLERSLQALLDDLFGAAHLPKPVVPPADMRAVTLMAAD